MTRRFPLVVFDWDGTVVDSTTMIAQSIQRAAEDLGLAVPTLDEARHVIGLGLADALARAVPNLPSERASEFVARYRSHYLAGESDLVMFDGMRELLTELRDAGARLAVATGKSRRGLDRALDTTGLRAIFATSRCADETHPKPHPAMLREIGDQLDVATNAMLMIGDTTHDLDMARAAGTNGIGVTYGAHPRDQLARCEPLALVDSTSELRAWLNTNP